MGKLFGTDGVRGLANAELTPELAYDLGRAGAYALTKEFNRAPKIIIGTDTRLSGDMLRSALAAGMMSVGATAVFAGDIPTPAIAYLTKKYAMDAGVMISASHNPYYDNGIKFINRDGFKLPDEIENEIEGIIFNSKDGIPRATNGEIGRIEYCYDALDDYVAFLASALGGERLEGLKIALDCSNGATSEAAPLVFSELGATVFVTANEPDGFNINRGAGCLHIDNLRAFAKDNGADLGFAFDGDGDRLICVDERGSEVDGDMIMSILATEMKKDGVLKKNAVVATVMSNLGFVNGCKNHGLHVETTKVGDRYVLEKMLGEGYSLGGEQSGHIIALDYHTTGDGLLSALLLIKYVKRSGKKLSELNSVMTKLPQILINAKVPNDKKLDYLTNERIMNKIRVLTEKYDGSGRILIRPSGTEPLVRVMIEGEDEAEILSDAKELSALIEM